MPSLEGANSVFSRSGEDSSERAISSSGEQSSAVGVEVRAGVGEEVGEGEGDGALVEVRVG